MTVQAIPESTNVSARENPGNKAATPFWPLMAAGSALLFLSSMRFGVAELGWIAFAPFLAAMYTDGGLKRHLWLFAVIAVAMTLTVGKIVTDQVPWFMAPMFSIPGAVFCFATISLAAAAHRRLGLRWGLYLFPSLAVTMEWLQYSFTDGGSWGALAYTQLDNLPLIQFVSLTGITGVSFLVGLGSSLTAAAYTVGPRAVKGDFPLFAVLTVAALVYGQLRLSQDAPGVPMRVAAVSSPLEVKELFAAINDISALRKYDDEFFARTEKAAALGAKTVVWNEAATIVAPADEAAFTARGQAMAKDREIILVMSYGVLLSSKPPHMENKYRMILPDGTVTDEYFKRHPVPGEGIVKGTKHAKVIPVTGGTLGGAICYDFDFPHIALDNARDGAGLVLLPSSDWRGIDPIHSRMARANAVAAGVAMVRSVRAATSLITDQYGRELGSMRYYGEGDGVMVAAVPAQAVPTLYVKTGDVLPWLTLIFSAIAIALMVWRTPA